MKTSKRLLSFFLAVVMVITTCSVGFVAFAADPEQSVFTVPKDENEAIEFTYDGLNALVDEYAPVLIEALRGTLEGIEGANIDVDAILAADEPINELLAQLSPWLMGLIGDTGASAESVLGSSYDVFSNTRYSYLEGDGSGMSFWNLYSFCNEHQNDGGAIGEFSSETFSKLSELLNAYSSAETSLDASLAAVDNALQTLLGSTGYALFYYDGTTRDYAISYNDTSDPQYESALRGVQNTGMYSSLPASKANIGNVLCVNGTTLGQLTAAIEANGNVYDSTIPGAAADQTPIDFNPFIAYTTYYAKKAFIIGQDETLSLLDAIYYYYNQNIVSNSYQILASLYANIDYDAIVTSMIGTREDYESDEAYQEAYNNAYASLTVEFPQSLLNTFLGEDITVQCSPQVYWFDSLLKDHPADTLDGSLLGSSVGYTKDNAHLFDGFYEAFVLSQTVLMKPGDSSTDNWYDYSVAYLLVATGIFDNIQAVFDAEEESKLDDTEWTQLKELLLANPDVSTAADLARLVESSTEITNQVLKYCAYSMHNNILGELRAWNPGQPLGTRMQNFANFIDANFYTSYVSREFRNETETALNSDYTEAAVELFKTEYVASSITTTYSFSEYAPEPDVAIEIVNTLINGYLEQYLDPDAPALFPGLIEQNISQILNNLLTTQVDLLDELRDIYLRLANDPIETLFEMLPLLVVLLDEVVVPILFNTPATDTDPEDTFYGVANLLLLFLGDYSQDGGSDIGIGQLGWNLNDLVPTLLHWLNGDNDYTYTYYNRTDNGDGTYTYNEPTTGANGTKYDDNGDPTGLVPVIVNIYYVDSFLANASILDLYEAADGEDPQMAQAVGETVTTLVTFATEAVDEYVAEHGDDVKSYKFDTPTTKGLNNLLVSIPSIIDIMGTKFMEKYNVDSDWRFFDEGRWAEDDDGCRYNVVVQNFKDLTTGGSAEDVLSTFVDMFINNWFNAITDFLNDVVSDKDNDITSNIPIVTSLLNAVDLFGEKSVLTDLLNGFFLFTRSDDYSFTFETQKNGYVGLDTLNAYFLLINLDKIVEIFTNIVNANQDTGSGDTGTDTGNPDTGEDTGNTGDSGESGGGFDISTILGPILESLNNVGPIANDSENIKGASELIDALDSLLSALLSNGYMNDYQLDKVDGVLSGVVTFLVNHFGEDKADEVWYLVTEYLKILNAGSANEDGSANADANAPVDPNKVYTEENLSNIVTQTYVLIESLINDKLVLAGDEYHLINSTVNGIISPSAIAVNSDSIDQDIMEYFSWSDLSASSYATDLGFNFSKGDKEAFYENLIDSLGVIPSILGVLLVDAGMYDNVLSPVFGTICNAMGVSYTAALPEDATGEDAVYTVIETVSNVLGSFLNAPVSGLLGLVRAIVAIAPDSFLSEVINGALDPIYNELNGACDIVSNLSPTLSTMLSDIVADFKTQIGSVIPSSNILLTLIGQIAGTDLSGIPLDIILNIIKPYTDSNERLLLMLYTVLVDVLTDDSILSQIMGNQLPWLKDLLTQYDSASLLKLIKDIVNSIQSTKEIKWMFDQSAAGTSSFEYPTGVTAQEAEDAIDSLDELVANLIPLLKEFGVVDQDNLADLLNGLIFTNANITAVVKGIYGGIENASNNDVDGIFVFSPSEFADYLMDSSYGATFSSAAAALRKCSTWSQVGTINWGFTDGSANAQRGFVQAFAAIARPANDVFAALLAEGDANLAAIAAQVLDDFTINTTEQSGDNTVEITLANNILTIKVTNNANANSKTNTIEVNLEPAIQALSVLTINGGNGYQSAIIPLFEALNIDSYVSYDQYLKNYNKAKDNVLIDVLNPIVDFLNDVTAAPFETLTAALPDFAAFLEDNGLGKIVDNLLAPISSLIEVLEANGINIDELIEQLAGKSLKELLEGLIKMDLGDVKLELTDLENSLNIQDILVPLVNTLLKDKGINIKLDDINWDYLAGLNNQGQVLITVLRYLEKVIINNSASINSLLGTIDAIKNNSTIQNILDSVFGQIATANRDDIVLAVFYLLLNEPTNVFFDYTNFKYKDYDFSYPTTVDIDFLTVLGPMLDGLIDGVMAEFLGGNLNSLVENNLYKDSIISSIATGLYGAIEGVKIDDSMNLTELLAMTGIDFSTTGVAALLVNDDYGQSYASAASVIRNAGSWNRVNADKLSWGVEDRDSFVHALSAVLRPLYGVLDVLLNDGSLGLFNLIYLPGSDGYTSTIVPLLEAFGCYNIKTQYQYRQDMSKEYDYILIDILNPLLDKVEDILNAPIQTLMDMLPNLALFFANDGLLQVIENLLTPISALLDALQPIADVNDILVKAGLDIEGELRKLGLVGSNYNFDIYDLAGSLKPLIGSDNIVSLLNTVLGMIDVGGSKLNIELMPIDWYQLASHGEVITNEASQASTHGKRVYVDADPNEVLIAVLRYLVETVNYKDNFNTINGLIGGLLGGADDSVADIVNTVLGVLTGETDEVISELCELLQTLA